MKLTIQNILHHEALTLDFEKGGNLITGINASGKTSIATAIIALASHDRNPLHLGLSAMRDYIRAGGGDGSATLDDDGEVVIWRPTSGIEVAVESIPISNPHSLGTIDFTASVSAKLRAEQWEKLFLPDSADDLLSKKWPHSQERLEEVVTLINERGWDGAASVFEIKRRESKSQWKKITGEDYGVTKAVAWVPQLWRDELHQASLESLGKKRSELQEKLNNINVEQAVNFEREVNIDEKVEENERVKAKLSSANDNLARQEGALAEQKGFQQSKNNEIVSLSEKIKQNKILINARPPMNCPSCSAGIKFESVGGENKLVSWTPPSREEISNALGSNSTLESRVKELNEAVISINSAVDALTQQCQTNYALTQSLGGESNVLTREIDAFNTRQQAKKSQEGNFVSSDEYIRVQRDYEQANQDIAAYEQQVAANRAHANVVEHDAVCQLLGVNGVRAQEIRGGMDKVRVLLSELTAMSGWKPITITADFAILCGGFSLATCADSEKMKAKFLLQIICAKLTGAKCVVLDAADKLRDGSWDGLVNIINANKETTIIVCATSTSCPNGWKCFSI